MDMSKRTKKDKRPVAKIDFKPYGAAIKAGRTKQKESRNKAADALFISPRYLANIENKGQHPSVQVFLELMSRYHIHFKINADLLLSCFGSFCVEKRIQDRMVRVNKK